MIKPGSKFLFALAAFGFLAAILYAAGTGNHTLGMDSIIGPLTFGYKGYVGEHTGYTILMSLSMAALSLGVFLSALHEADPEAEAQVVGLETVPDAVVADTVNYWPVVGAFSLAAVAVGLALGPALFVIGFIGITVTTVEWAVRAWSDRSTGDPEANRAIRNRFMYPVEIPGIAVLGIGGFVLAISRILLALPHLGAYLVFGLVPVAIMALGALVVLKPQVSQSVIAGLLVVGGLAVLVGGIVAAAAGEQKLDEKHETDGGTHGEGGLSPLPAPSATVVVVRYR